MGGITLSSLLLLAAAALNGYPLVYSDTGTYVHSAFTWRIPSDRPVFYGAFLAATSAQRSLWGPVVAQAVIVAVVIRFVLRVLAPELGVTALIVVAASLAATTALPWFVGQLSPDVFAGVLVLSFFLVLDGSERLGRAARRFAAGCLVVCVLVHASHLLLAGVLAAAAQLWARWSRPSHGWQRGARRAWRVLAAAVLIMVAGNLILSGRLAINRGAHAFLMGRLIEDGVMQQVLDARCPRESYRLCAFRDRLPASADDYLWDTKGLLERTGGWRGSRSESWQLIVVALVTHPLLVAEGALRSSGRQLVRFRTGEVLQPLAAGSWADVVIAQRFPRQYDDFQRGRQQRGTLAIAELATLHFGVALAAGVALVLALALARDAFPEPWSPFLGLVAVGLVANAAIMGALSGPHDRYQARVIWLVVLAPLVAVLRWAKRRPSAS